MADAEQCYHRLGERAMTLHLGDPFVVAATKPVPLMQKLDGGGGVRILRRFELVDAQVRHSRSRIRPRAEAPVVFHAAIRPRAGRPACSVGTGGFPRLLSANELATQPDAAGSPGSARPQASAALFERSHFSRIRMFGDFPPAAGVDFASAVGDVGNAAKAGGAFQ
jgi:hypothetical protein